MFTFRQHSATITGIRCIDLPITVRCKRDFAQPLVIIPGPREPGSFAPYLDLLLEDLNTLGPSGERRAGGL